MQKENEASLLLELEVAWLRNGHVVFSEQWLKHFFYVLLQKVSQTPNQKPYIPLLMDVIISINQKIIFDGDPWYHLRTFYGPLSLLCCSQWTHVSYYFCSPCWCFILFAKLSKATSKGFRICPYRHRRAYKQMWELMPSEFIGCTDSLCSAVDKLRMTTCVIFALIKVITVGCVVRSLL